MTPEEFTEILQRIEDGSELFSDTSRLADALEAAWAELDQSEALFREQAIAHVREHERAERAEAEVERANNEVDRKAAALARVRALCDYYDGGLCRKCAAAVRDAIKGDNQ